MKQTVLGILLWVLFCPNPADISAEETTFSQALQYWPEMPQQVTFIGLKNCPTKFQIYWNGAISCFVGRDCFGNFFPPQRKQGEQFEKDQVHLTFGYGAVPRFECIDNNQVAQSLLEGFLPITETSWKDESGVTYTVQSFVTSFDPSKLSPRSTTQVAMCLSRVSITPVENDRQDIVHLWLNFSGYRAFFATDKEKPEDAFPVYGRSLRLEQNHLVVGDDSIRVAFKLPSGAKMEFFKEYPNTRKQSQSLQLAEKKGLLKNLLHIAVPCKTNKTIVMEVILPYFPVPLQRAAYLNRDYDSEFQKIVQYWQYFYNQDAVIRTPDPFVNNFYKAGLWHLFISADEDPETGRVYAKLSPAWYESIWPNCAMITAVSLDQRGHHELARQFLDPFVDWQGVRQPPGMKNASSEGFFCPPKEYTAIPWVSNHGNTLWGLCEHYRITRDPNWAARITKPVLKGCDWIIQHRQQTQDQLYGKGLLPAGTVSDDKGSGQYLATDAHNYRGLRSAADFLNTAGHLRAQEIEQTAAAYRQDIRTAVQAVTKRNNPVTLTDDRQILFVPAKIDQIQPPKFEKYDFWPYINYIDVGPMHLIDSGVFSGDSDIARWILAFEEKFTVARLRSDISLTENWCFSIQHPGDHPAHLLRYGVSVVEPFYSPRSTLFLETDDIENYIKVFYHQLAAGLSHHTLTTAENRYGVWGLAWADAEFHRMLLRMLVIEQEDSLCLLKAIPRCWLEDGKIIEVKNQPTSFGVLNFSVLSKLQNDIIEMDLEPPVRSVPKKITVRFHHPAQRDIRKVHINGVPREHFEKDMVVLDGPYEKKLNLQIYF